MHFVVDRLCGDKFGLLLHNFVYSCDEAQLAAKINNLIQSKIGMAQYNNMELSNFKF